MDKVLLHYGRFCYLLSNKKERYFLLGQQSVINLTIFTGIFKVFTFLPLCYFIKSLFLQMIIFLTFTAYVYTVQSRFSNIDNLQFSGCFAKYNYSIYYIQSYYREVPRWEIFMEQELRFGPIGSTEKKGLGRL